jgi:hypothetical protein
MSTRRPLAVVRSWIGLAAAAIVLCLAAWLTGEYVHAAWVAPADKARVESLKERARTDATIHRNSSSRVRPAAPGAGTAAPVYRGAACLLVSLGVFLAWIKWLKPGPGDWARSPWL